MLKSITDPTIFQIVKISVLAEWRRAGEDAFADYFDQVFCSDLWDGGSFYAGSAGIQGVANHNQCVESLFRCVVYIYNSNM